MKRIRYTIILSAPSFPYPQVLEYLTPLLGQQFAGACCSPVNGIWSSEGALFQDQYNQIKQEPGMQILISVLPEQENIAYQKIKNMLQALKKDTALEIEWVHVEKEEIEALHFQLTH